MYRPLYNRATEAPSMKTPAWARILVVILAVATFCAHRSLACSCGILPSRPGNCDD
jgi:hypothetical protein